jgi:hypothetical protein
MERDGKRRPSVLIKRAALIAVALLQLSAGAAQACLFARDTEPPYWFEWASALFAGDVTNVERNPEKGLDVITVRVVETYKGPQGAIATLQIPSRMWSSCRLELPAVGAHVLVALNPNSDTLLVPLTAGYAERLRQLRGKSP